MTRQDDGAELVCGVSMPLDGSDAHDSVVAKKKADDTISLGLEHRVR